MMRNTFLFFLVLAFAVFFGRSLQASFGDIPVSASNTPVVVELFTSQSCSSCPPADKAFEEISAHPHIIALSCHVTYWNHLHWQDMLSHEFCTARQREGAAAKGSRKVYTPQMVVNGASEFVGSRRGQIAAEIDQAARTGNVKPIELSAVEDGKINLSLPALDEAGDYTIWVFGTTSQHEQAIPSGENAGREIVYVNAAQTVQELKAWDGRAEMRGASVQGDDNTPVDGVVVIAQKKRFGPIVAAGKLEF